MKIVFISEAASYHTQRWCRGLAAAGCDMHLVSASAARIDGVVTHCVPMYSSNWLMQAINVMRVRKLLRSLKPDIIHLFSLFPASSLGSMWMCAGWPALVVSVWGSDIVNYDRESPHERIIKKFLLGQACRICATSQYLATECRRYSSSPEKISVLPWGVDTTQYSPSPEKRGAESAVVIGFAKRLHWLSAPDTALKAFAAARARCGKKIVLRIAGDGPMSEELRAMSVSLGIDSSVEWLGWLGEQKRLCEFYRSLDIFLMPSRHEAFGLSAVEAAACGIATVATRAGGIPEIVEPERTGLLAETDNVESLQQALCRLINDESLRTRLGAQARHSVEEKFTLSDSVARMIDIYKSVCTRRQL